MARGAKECVIMARSRRLLIPDYPELLMWDQLRGVMKDPDNNPFPGFSEAPIDFAPTFKVDYYLRTGVNT